MEDGDDLEDDEGVARFTIDSLTGQIRVGKVLGADPDEIEDEDSTAPTLTGNPALPQAMKMPASPATASTSYG